MTPAAQKIALMILAGASVGDITAQCSRLGLDETTVGPAIEEARRSITLAADYNRDEQIAIAFTRLNSIYSTSCEIDPKTALAAQKELNKLLSLYSGTTTAAPANAAGGSEVAAELDRVAAHLLPLNLAPDTYPISEHARLAAAKARG